MTCITFVMFEMVCNICCDAWMQRILEVGRYLSSIDREDIDAHFLKDKRCCKRFVGEIRQIQSWVNGVEAREYALSERRGG